MDVSDSVGPGPQAPPEDVRIASTWFAFGAEIREMEGRESPPAMPRDGTRLAGALRQAAARYPGRDLWVFTDGRGTDGDAEAAARAIAASGSRVHVSAPLHPAADVALLAARARREAGAGIRVEARIAASTDGEIRVRLVRGGRRVAEESIAVAAGTSRTVTLEDRQAPTIGAAYLVSIVPLAGTPNDDPANDTLALGLPGDRPSVLVWTDLTVPAWIGPELPFEPRHMTVWDAGLLHTADCVVLGSLPYRRIGDARVRALVRFVAGGGRLLVLGGPRSWAAGGWAGTALEDRLTGLRVPRPEGPGLVLVVALDRSGSTAGGALDHLRDAILGVAAELGPGERLAILPFSDRPEGALLAPGWLAAEDPEAQHAALATSLEALVPGGGTDLVAAIRAAAQRAGDVEARTRRVLLVSDGDPDHDPGDAALAELRADLDARGVGFGALLSGMPLAARRLAARVARRPEDVVLLESAVDVPSRLLHEVSRLRAAGERLPAPASLRPVGGGALPGLGRMAPTAVQALEATPEGRITVEAAWATDPPGTWPFAARRRVGAGEVVALAWGPALERSPQTAGLTLLPLLSQLASEADRGLEASRVGRGELAVRIPTAAGAGQVTLEGPAGRSTLLEVGPGLFRGPIRGIGAPAGGGEWRVRLPEGGIGGAVRPLRLPAEPEAEHRGAGVDEAAIRRLAAAGQGARLEAGARPPPGRLPPGPALRPFFLLLAAILLVLDRAWAVRSRRAGGRAA